MVHFCIDGNEFPSCSDACDSVEQIPSRETSSFSNVANPDTVISRKREHFAELYRFFGPDLRIRIRVCFYFGQETPRVVWNPKARCHIHINLQLSLS